MTFNYQLTNSPTYQLHPVSAVLIATAESPLRVGQGYLMDWPGGAVSGHIRSVTRRLHPSVTSSSDALLHPRELACVEIEMSAPSLPGAPLNRVQQMAVVEPATGETIGTGLLIPHYTRKEDPNAPADSAGLTVWFTGLSGSGKTTIAQQVCRRLSGFGVVEMLDADIVRTYLCKDLGYSKSDREENVRRLGFVADLLTQKGIVVLITAIAPYRAMRDELRRAIGRFVEVYVNAPIAVCEQRDVKGLYKRARAGEIRSFTGIDDPYEAPLAPEVECRTDVESIEASVSKVIAAITNFF